jgi:hypothetical protein
VETLLIHRIASQRAYLHEEMTTAPNISVDATALPLLQFTVAAVSTRAVRFTGPVGDGGCTWVW